MNKHMNKLIKYLYSSVLILFKFIVKYLIIFFKKSRFVEAKMIGWKMTQTKKCNSRHKNIPTVIICERCEKIVTAVTK